MGEFCTIQVDRVDPAQFYTLGGSKPEYPVRNTPEKLKAKCASTDSTRLSPVLL